VRRWKCKGCAWESTSSPHVRARYCIRCTRSCVRTDGGTIDQPVAHPSLHWDLYERVSDAVPVTIYQETTAPVSADEAMAVLSIERELRRGVLPPGKA
jgi:hypothetical protein